MTSQHQISIVDRHGARQHIFGRAALLTVLCCTQAAPSSANDIVFQDGFESTLVNTSCTDARLLRSDVTYGPIHPTQINPARPGVDTTEWDSIWGHASATDAVFPWPGRSGSAPVLRHFSRSNFVAIHFRTPATASAASTLTGFFTYPLDWNDPNADMAISTKCGDFNSNPQNPGCVVLDTPAINEAPLWWKFSPGNESRFCILQPDRDYFLNIRLTDPTSQLRCDPLFGAESCPLYLVHTYGGAL